MCLGTSHLGACWYEGGQMPTLSSSQWRVMHKLSGVFCFQFPPLRCKTFSLGSMFKNILQRKGERVIFAYVQKHLVWGENLYRAKMSVLINSSFVQDCWKFSYLTQQNQNFIALLFDVRSSIPSTYLLRSWFRSCETWRLIPHSKRCHTCQDIGTLCLSFPSYKRGIATIFLCKIHWGLGKLHKRKHLKSKCC